jgi:tellurite resistance protein TehA-like permease
MATGIVSVGLRSHGVPALSAALMWLAAACYVVLIVLNGWRIAAFRDEVRGDLTHPGRGFGFFTFVAGTDVLGARLALDGHTGAAAALLLVGVLSWLVLGYAVPWTAARNRGGQPSVARANGTWFVWVVASQSVAVLAAVLEPVASVGRRELALLAIFNWSVGVFLYAAVGILVIGRLMLYELRPADLSPPYWGPWAPPR